MPDYSKIVIYKIQHLKDESLLYVGSTTNFTRRKCEHKSHSYVRTSKFYKMMRDYGGWGYFKMVQLKEYPCKNKREAELEEDRIMMEMKANMNGMRPSRSKEQYNLDNSDNIKQYYVINRDKYKQYYIDNRDKMLQKGSQKVTCECGCVISRSSLSKHRKTQKHLEILKQSQ